MINENSFCSILKLYNFKTVCINIDLRLDLFYLKIVQSDSVLKYDFTRCILSKIHNLSYNIILKNRNPL